MTDLLAEAVAATDWKRNPHKTAAGQAAALRAALRERGVRLVTVESLRKALPEDWEPFWEEMPVIGNANQSLPQPLRVPGQGEEAAEVAHRASPANPIREAIASGWLRREPRGFVEQVGGIGHQLSTSAMTGLESANLR